MKLIKTVTDGLPEGYSIHIYAEYKRMYIDSFIVPQDTVEIQGNLYNEQEIIYTDTEHITMPKPKRKWLFFKEQPKYTWKESCEIISDDMVDYLSNMANKNYLRNQITNRLFDVLDELEV